MVLLVDVELEQEALWDPLANGPGLQVHCRYPLLPPTPVLLRISYDELGPFVPLWLLSGLPLLISLHP